MVLALVFFLIDHICGKLLRVEWAQAVLLVLKFISLKCALLLTYS